MRNNLVGLVFGRLTVIKYAGQLGKSNNISYWNCSCKCGKSKIVRYDKLINRQTQSCGCLARELSSKIHSSNLINQKFGKLLIINRVYNIGSRVTWECLCDCGNTRYTTTSLLTSGVIKDCQKCGHQRLRENNTQNLVGRRFNKLFILKPIYTENDGLKWLCKCDCGKEKLCTTSKLISGDNKSCGCSMNLRCKDHPNYKHDMTDKDREELVKKRKLFAAKSWRKKIVQRDNYTCMILNQQFTSKDLRAHHLYSWRDNEDKRYDLSNGTTLHKDVHDLFHKLYGHGKNTPEQFKEFKQRWAAGEFSAITSNR